MKNFDEMEYQKRIAQNIRKILSDRGLTQSSIAVEKILPEGKLSKILNCEQMMKVEELSIIASKLSLRDIDILTYPDVYVARDPAREDPVEAVLQIKLKKDKKDQVLKLVFGDNDIEILNK